MKSKGRQLVRAAICLVVIIAGLQLAKPLGITEILSKVSALFTATGKQLAAAVIVAACIIAVTTLMTLCLSLIKAKGHRGGTMLTLTQSLIRYVAVILIICSTLSILGADLSTIAASVGLVALIVGFSAESLIEDVITGFFMFFEGQYNVGDILEIDGFRGTVTAIGIRTTSITDAGGNIKIINNSNMKDILNRSDNVSRSVSEIAVAYATDIEVLEEKLPAMMDAIYEKHKDVMKAKPVYLGVAALGDSGVTLKFCVEVDEKNIYSVQRILNRELWVGFNKAGVEIPFPQVDVHQR